MTVLRPPLAVAALLAAACGSEPPPPPASAPAPAPAPVVPADPAGFLRALVPGTGGPLLVVYRLEGPAGIEGTLEIMTRPGIHARENWTVRVPLDGGAPLVRTATTIVGPAGIVTTTSDGATFARRLPFAAWAEAYAAAPATERRRIAEAVRRFHEQVAAARAEHRGNRKTVAGLDCLALRVAAQSLCLWEEAGLALRYRGPLVSAEAVRIDRAPALADGAFDLPPIPDDAPPSEDFADLAARPAAEILDRLADADPGVLARVALANLRPPSGLFELPSSARRP